MPAGCTGIVPEWYPDYEIVKKYKKKLYVNFFLTQMLYHHSKMIRLINNFILKKQDIKSDRVLKNVVRLLLRKKDSVLEREEMNC